MTEPIRVAVLGVCGRMGREVVKAVASAGDMDVVGACDVVEVGKDIGSITGLAGLDAVNSPSLEEMLEGCSPRVVVDFSKPFDLARELMCIRRGVSPVVGTTGQTDEEIDAIRQASDEYGVGAIVAPNFAIGAILMMKFAAQAAKYMPAVEIIELHHDKKADAPSGTAIKTAHMIAEAKRSARLAWESPGPEGEPARGADRDGINVHSVRLPGLVAHQEVLFGGMGQTLSIRHDSIDRTSFMPGVLLAIRRVARSRGFVYGLENLI